MSEIEAAVKEFREKAIASLDVYTAIATRAGNRLVSKADEQPAPSGQPTSPNQPPAPAEPTWMEDIVTFWSQAGQDALNLLTLQQKLAAQATKK